ncbi:putative transcription corepressor [Kockovaella imperatae]|uniref:Protein HIR n=1 Tax=Kockovaella imperatae TaxID=4999 RepID=A0A1Y1URS3_9TREE|nr:putative transcription corepressor [Kockovaella imperatae]ORX40750.1 putative transcription corepressor [Kockovaella imperatae]
MRLTRPNWVKHTDDKDRRSPIFSISVHPDGTRLATGGLDKKVKIWSTLPILDKETDENEANHKLLCTMSSHTGSVLAVRWAHHGRFLASGSDDTVIVIWGIDPDGGGRVFGSDEVNVENWKALTRLVGHTADIIDLAWSRDDSMMASVGLDKLVWIWDGQSFDRLRKIDLHGDFVKGVCWDPVGNFLATQSDDKTVKIWDTANWNLVHSVSAPFKNSPKSTFFRRLSWSPDGAFIAASNAMNGPVFVAAVIEREGWNADISFVGHGNTIQVAAFNPRLFFREGDDPGRATASCMLALGADDFSISIWRNTLHKPVVVLADVFNRPLLDLCWATDGHQLYGCSADGTICAISFDDAELPELAEIEKTELVLNEYGYKPVRKSVPRPIQSQTPVNGFGPQPSGSHVNVIQPRKGKSKAQSLTSQKRRVELGGFGPPADSHDAFSSGQLQPLGSGQDHTARMFEDAHAAFGDNSAGPSNLGQKRKASLSNDDHRQYKGRTMGSSRSDVDVKEIRAPRVVVSGDGSRGRTLPVPRVQTLLRVKSTYDESLYLEAENSEDAKGKTRVALSQDGQNQWLDFMPGPVIAMVLSESFCAVGCEDGMVMVYSPAGRHIKLDSSIAEMTGNRDKLFVITASCTCHILDVKSGKSLFPPVSMSHLLGDHNISSISVRPHGVPIITTSHPCAYAYDTMRDAWTPLTSSWWLESSPLADRRSRPGPSGPLADIEGEVSRLWKGNQISEGEKPEWWDVALELGHLESKVRAAELLQSKEEYKFWLIRVAGILGREGFRARAEELIKDLLGPLYSHPGRDAWVSTVIGLQRRDLLKQVLTTFAQSTSLSGLAQHYQGIMKEIAAEASEL